MPSVPLPFVVGAALLVLLVALARRDGVRPGNAPFLTLIGVCAVQSALLGLRWGYGVDAARHAIPILAATIPPLVYASFGSLTSWAATPRAIWPHAVPALAVALLVALWREPLDIVLVGLFLGYAAALWRLAARGPDALNRARFEGAVPAHRALRLAAVALATSACVDAFVAFDFEWSQGAHATPLFAATNLLSLFALGFAAAVAGGHPVPEEADVVVERPPLDQAEDREVVAKASELLRAHRLFRQHDLSLTRLARKIGVPARRVSEAINRIEGKNVSQYVNEHRVAEACRLLATSDLPITTIMLDAGFQTKSNFNREFLRVTGSSPSAWRARNPGPR